jgi:hypothetical protein
MTVLRGGQIQETLQRQKGHDFMTGVGVSRGCCSDYQSHSCQRTYMTTIIRLSCPSGNKMKLKKKWEPYTLEESMPCTLHAFTEKSFLSSRCSDILCWGRENLLTCIKYIQVKSHTVPSTSCSISLNPQDTFCRQRKPWFTDIEEPGLLPSSLS